MTKRRYTNYKKNISKKIKYGGLKTNEEVVKSTNKIVQTLFSREKNIIYFLEFIKNQLNSKDDNELNDAITINDKLNTFTLLIELINSKIFEIGNQQNLETINNEKNDVKSSNKSDEEKPEEEDEDEGEGTWKDIGTGGTSKKKYYKKNLKVNKFITGGNGDNDDSDDDIFFTPLYESEEDRRNKLEKIKEEVNNLLENPKTGTIVFNPRSIDAENVALFVPDLTKTQAFKNLDEDYTNNWEESLKENALESTENIYNFIKQLIEEYTDKKIKIFKKENLNLLQATMESARKFSLFLLLSLKNSVSDTTSDTTKAEPLDSLITQEDIDNLNILKNLETNLVELDFKFKNILSIKFQNILDKSVLVLISDKFYKEFHRELKEYIVKYKKNYKSFIISLIDIKQEGTSVLSTALKIKELNKFFQDKIINILTNDELLEKLLHAHGTALDIKSILTIRTILMSGISGNILQYFTTKPLSNLGIATTIGKNVGYDLISPEFKTLIEQLLQYMEIRSDFVDDLLKTDSPIGKDFTINSLNSMAQIAGHTTIFTFNKIRSSVSSIANFLYRNAESTKKIIDTMKEKKNIINLLSNLSNTLEDTTYQVINYSNNDELWNLIRTKVSSYKDIPYIQAKIKSQYTQILFDYRKLIVDINSAICKIRCIDTFLPETILESSMNSDNNSVENISYYDLPDIEYTVMYLFISKQYPRIGDTLLFMDNLIKQVDKAYNIKFALEDLCEYIKSEILKILDTLTSQKAPKQNNSSSQVKGNNPRFSPTGSRIGLLGGARNLPENKKEEILKLICNVIICDIKIKYAINQDNETDIKANELLLNNSILELKKLSEVNSSENMINGDELLTYIKTNNYDDFLQRAYQNYESKLSSIPKQGITDISFLDTINFSIGDLRIKLSFEFFRIYLNNEDYKIFKDEYQDELEKNINIIPTTIIQNASSYAINGLLYFSSYWQQFKIRIAPSIGNIARYTGIDSAIREMEKIKPTSLIKTAVKSSLDNSQSTKGGSKKIYNKNNNKRKTKTLKNYTAKR